jgi:hypothetical protein
MNTHTGKIARLPRPIRDELNERLERSEPAPRLLAWLNALKDVRRIVKDHFAGIPISKQNLSEWRQSGFQEWLVRQELSAAVRNVDHFAGDLGSDRDNMLADGVATVLAARYAALISKWDGEADEKLEAGAKMLNGLCRGVVRLQRGMHQAAKDNRQFIQELEEKRQRSLENCKKQLLDQVWAIQREPLVAKIFGGGDLGRKIAKYVIAVENGRLDAKLGITEEDLQKSNKRRTTQKPMENMPETIDNPLEANEMDGKRDAQTRPSESNQVKANQTDQLTL